MILYKKITRLNVCFFFKLSIRIRKKRGDREKGVPHDTIFPGTHNNSTYKREKLKYPFQNDVFRYLSQGNYQKNKKKRGLSLLCLPPFEYQTSSGRLTLVFRGLSLHGPLAF